MIEVVEDIKYFSLKSYMDFLKIEKEVSNDLNDLRAIAFILSEKFIEENISKQHKYKILNWLCSLDVISIAVINCNISEKSIEYLLSFDLCLETTKSSITLNGLSNTDYFTDDHIKLLLGHSTNFPLINGSIDSENIESSVCQFVAPILEGKTSEYIGFLKKYFNLYKQTKDINRSILQWEETISFCELSIKKYENG